jgi:hypothetical protein
MASTTSRSSVEISASQVEQQQHEGPASRENTAGGNTDNLITEEGPDEENMEDEELMKEQERMEVTTARVPVTMSLEAPPRDQLGRWENAHIREVAVIVHSCISTGQDCR